MTERRQPRRRRSVLTRGELHARALLRILERYPEARTLDQLHARAEGLGMCRQCVAWGLDELVATGALLEDAAGQLFTATAERQR
jgi:hypothetical protein